MLYFKLVQKTVSVKAFSTTFAIQLMRSQEKIESVSYEKEVQKNYNLKNQVGDFFKYISITIDFFEMLSF